jgi:hypothetical protein
MANLHDALWKYTRGVASGAFDADLSHEDRAMVLAQLSCALTILQGFGGTDAVSLWRMVRDPYQTPLHVNERVRQIIEGCAA